MGLLAALWNRSSDKHLIELAEKIAERNCSAVWERIRIRAVSMTPSEARGYIRSHASLPLQAAASLALSHRASLGPSAVVKVADLAKDKLVEVLLREVVRTQQTTAVHRRRAA